MSPLVTVIALNYKQCAYVAACLDSVLRQTYPSLEIIFIDNGSEDSTARISGRRYPAVDSGFPSPEPLFFRAHNQAIRKAQGEFILPLNVDMVLTDTCIEQHGAGNADGRPAREWCPGNSCAWTAGCVRLTLQSLIPPGSGFRRSCVTSTGARWKQDRGQFEL